MTFIFLFLSICAYDLCGLLAVICFTHKGYLYNNRDTSSAAIILVFWPVLCAAYIGMAVYRLVRGFKK